MAPKLRCPTTAITSVARGSCRAGAETGGRVTLLATGEQAGGLQQMASSSTRRRMTRGRDPRAPRPEDLDRVPQVVRTAEWAANAPARQPRRPLPGGLDGRRRSRARPLQPGRQADSSRHAEPVAGSRDRGSTWPGCARRGSGRWPPRWPSPWVPDRRSEDAGSTTRPPELNGQGDPTAWACLGAEQRTGSTRSRPPPARGATAPAAAGPVNSSAESAW